jgi:hypothetical protein
VKVDQMLSKIRGEETVNYHTLVVLMD